MKCRIIGLLGKTFRTVHRDWSLYHSCGVGTVSLEVEVSDIKFLSRIVLDMHKFILELQSFFERIVNIFG